MALLGGLFMNLNFVLAGEPSPSAFYIPIQLALLAANAGLVLGLDGLRTRAPKQQQTVAVAPHLVGAAALLLLSVAALPFAENLGLGSVEDPAVILALTDSFAASCLLVSALRSTPRTPDNRRRSRARGRPSSRSFAHAGNHGSGSSAR